MKLKFLNLKKDLTSKNHFKGGSLKSTSSIFKMPGGGKKRQKTDRPTSDEEEEVITYFNFLFFSCLQYVRHETASHLVMLYKILFYFRPRNKSLPMKMRQSVAHALLSLPKRKQTTMTTSRRRRSLRKSLIRLASRRKDCGVFTMQCSE